jgi:hypothetical protein
MLTFLEHFRHKHKFETCFGFFLGISFSNVPSMVFYLITWLCNLLSRYNLVKNIQNLKVQFWKRPLQLLIQTCNNSHLFIPIQILGNIFWHAIDKHEKNNYSHKNIWKKWPTNIIWLVLLIYHSLRWFLMILPKDVFALYNLVIIYSHTYNHN